MAWEGVKYFVCDNVRKANLYIRIIIFDHFNYEIISSSSINQYSRISRISYICTCIIHYGQNMSKKHLKIRKSGQHIFYIF